MHLRRKEVKLMADHLEAAKQIILKEAEDSDEHDKIEAFALVGLIELGERLVDSIEKISQTAVEIEMDLDNIERRMRDLESALPVFDGEFIVRVSGRVKTD